MHVATDLMLVPFFNILPLIEGLGPMTTPLRRWRESTCIGGDRTARKQEK